MLIYRKQITIEQTKEINKHLTDINETIDYFVHVNVPQEKLIERLTRRRVCPTCGSTYHVMYNPPVKEGVCDKDGSQLIQREDDSAETVAKRLAVNIEQTQPLLDIYDEKGYLVTVNGEQKIDQVFQDIQTKLDK